jgi:3-hydroxyisobutyrate dehydrogenase
MARNLQAKLPPGDTIRVFDINKAASEKLVQDMKAQQAGGAAPEVAVSAGDAAKDAVCDIFLHSLPLAPDPRLL